MWWAATLGHSTEQETAGLGKAKRGTGRQCVVRDSRLPVHGRARSTEPRQVGVGVGAYRGSTAQPEGSIQFQPGMLDPYTPELTWTWIKWARSASKLPIVVKGVLDGGGREAVRRRTARRRLSFRITAPGHSTERAARFMCWQKSSMR